MATNGYWERETGEVHFNLRLPERNVLPRPVTGHNYGAYHYISHEYRTPMRHEPIANHTS